MTSSYSLPFNPRKDDLPTDWQVVVNSDKLSTWLDYHSDSDLYDDALDELRKREDVG